MAKFDGLLYIPATDMNFISGIQNLKDTDLEKMLDKLIELDASESGHKGRIKAVEKELKTRNGSSKGIIAADKMQTDIETAERLYGDGMPYELDRIENEIRFYMAQTAQALFESGKRFLRIKAHEDHGAFYAALERIGVSERTADYAMAVVNKFGPNPPALADLGSAKLKMLTVFEEKEIKKYVNGGPLGNISHDDVEQMTTRELQDAIRKLREKVKKTEDVAKEKIRQKDEQITKMEFEIEGRSPPTKEQKAIAELATFNDDYFKELAAAMSGMRNAVDILNQAQCVPGVNVQILDDWINKHNDEMVLLNGVHEELIGIIDNLHPVNKGKV